MVEELKGWIKDEEDSRDFPASALVFAELPLPTTYTVYPGTPVYSQGNRPACVGYACAGVKTDEEYLQHADLFRFDGSWLYDECKKIDGIPNTPGTYLRDAMKVLSKQGMRQLRGWCQKKRPDEFWQIGSYFRIPSDATDEFIKQVIFQFGSIAIGSKWYANWMKPVGKVLMQPEGWVGNHAYRICGWDDRPPYGGWLIVNSWGKNWGVRGTAFMPYDVLWGLRTISDRPADLWKLVDK